MRKHILKIHSVIGLIMGIVVLIVSITGCLWVFKEELEDSKPKPVSDYQANVGVITPTESKLIGEEINPNREIHGVLYQKEHDYTGEKLGQKDHLSGFFSFILDGHVNLWLTFQWEKTTRWIRKNYDLHSVLGFYICSLAFVLAFTGSVMAFDWFYFITYKAWGGDKSPGFVIPNVTKTEDMLEETIPMDFLIPKLKKENPNADNFELHYPSSDSSSVYVELGYSNLHYSNDYKFFNPQTLEEIKVNGIYGAYEDTDLADLIIRANYDIHVGAIGGLLGEILAFIISLLSASLPITGFLMWYGRRKKKKNK